MSYVEVFGVLAGVGVAVSKFFGVGAVVFKPETGAASESENVTALISDKNLRSCISRASSVVVS